MLVLRASHGNCAAGGASVRSRHCHWHRVCSLRPQRLTRTRPLAAAQAHALELALAAGSEPVSGADTLRDLVIVAGHAVFTGTNFADAGDQDSWCAHVETVAARWARIRARLAPARPQAGALRSCRLSTAPRCRAPQVPGGVSAGAGAGGHLPGAHAGACTCVRSPGCRHTSADTLQRSRLALQRRRRTPRPCCSSVAAPRAPRRARCRRRCRTGQWQTRTAGSTPPLSATGAHSLPRMACALAEALTDDVIILL
jgi:hypothetical protein